MLHSDLYCYEFFFFDDPATTEIYTLSLHDALPISLASIAGIALGVTALITTLAVMSGFQREIRDRMLQMAAGRSEEHTSELQSQSNLVCRLLLEKKKNETNRDKHIDVKK